MLRFRPVLFYVLTFAIAWVAWTPLILFKLKGIGFLLPYPVLLFLCQTVGAFAPLLSLLLLQRITNDTGLVKSVFGKLRFRGVPFLRLLTPALMPIVLAVLSGVVFGMLSSERDLVVLRPGPVDELGWALLVLIPFSFAMGMIGSPFGEEPGWRGYVFDSFLEKDRGYVGSCIVAVLWWIWHIPLFIVLDVPINAFSFLELVGHSLLIDSLFMLSGSNLLVAMLYHQGLNTSFMFFASKTQSASGLILLLGIALMGRVFAERTRRSDHR